MYNTYIVAERIRKLSKEKGISVKSLLESCGLGRNFMASSLDAGSMPKADNIAKIADELDCSIDYLLGRTDEIEYKRTSKVAEIKTPAEPEKVYRLPLSAYEGDEQTYTDIPLGEFTELDEAFKRLKEKIRLEEESKNKKRRRK